jgi:DNA-binding SARP family transcriptional activator
MLRPLPGHRPPEGFAAQSVLHTPLSTLTGPVGSYSAETLAAIIEEGGGWRDCVWLRPDSLRPGAVADSLAAACRHRWAAVNGNGQRAARPLMASDGATLHDVIREVPERAVLVLELGGALTRALGHMLADLRPVLADRGASLVTVSEHNGGNSVVRKSDRVVPTSRLTHGLDPGIRRDDSVLPSACLERLARMEQTRWAVVRDIVAASEMWPANAIAEAVAGGWNSWLLIDRVTRMLLDQAESHHLDALEICAATGYWHPDLATDGPPASELRPWVLPMEQQWGWLRPVWRRSLTRHLRARARKEPSRPASAGSLRRKRPENSEPTTSVTMDVRMLGTFEVRVDGIVVATPPGHRGIAVLRYVLSRPGHTASRDELLEEFWPDVEPAIARNRLQVAVSSVRRALREVTNASILEYRNGGYRIDTDVELDIDIESFEGTMARARAAAHAHDTANAIALFRRAVSLYRGDFASDAPFEQWTLLPRESLRLKYVDALDRVSRMQLAAGRIDECIATAHRMLDVDPCREDAHRLLMRCYVDQGRVHQALRQFELCRRVLDTTLGVAPSPETIGLRDAVRRGSVLPAWSGRATRNGALPESLVRSQSRYAS